MRSPGAVSEWRPSGSRVGNKSSLGYRLCGGCRFPLKIPLWNQAMKLRHVCSKTSQRELEHGAFQALEIRSGGGEQQAAGGISHL